jgi:hypothetical protein
MDSSLLDPRTSVLYNEVRRPHRSCREQRRYVGARRQAAIAFPSTLWVTHFDDIAKHPGRMSRRSILLRSLLMSCNLIFSSLFTSLNYFGQFPFQIIIVIARNLRSRRRSRSTAKRGRKQSRAPFSKSLPARPKVLRFSVRSSGGYSNLPKIEHFLLKINCRLIKEDRQRALSAARKPAAVSVV